MPRRASSYGFSIHKPIRARPEIPAAISSIAASLKTGLVYIPVIDTPAVWVNLPENDGIVKYLNGFFTTNGIFPDDTYDAAALKQDFGPLPDLKTLQATRKVKLVRELLLAWDPIAQNAV